MEIETDWGHERPVLEVVLLPADIGGALHRIGLSTLAVFQNGPGRG